VRGASCAPLVTDTQPCLLMLTLPATKSGYTQSLAQAQHTAGLTCVQQASASQLCPSTPFQNRWFSHESSGPVDVFRSSHVAVFLQKVITRDTWCLQGGPRDPPPACSVSSSADQLPSQAGAGNASGLWKSPQDIQQTKQHFSRMSTMLARHR
jgi:hypothetical protein